MENTILIAEDDPAILDVLVFLLTDAGYGVLVAGDGDAAVALLASHEPDLFLLDVMMPGRDGYDVARAIRADERFADRHILFLTARADEKSRRTGYATGAEQYITKPFDNDDLLGRIAELLA